MSKSNVMIDIEGLGCSDNALIVSIGAVRFDSKGLGEEFYTPCFHQQSERAMDISTVKWWMSQSDGARAVFQEKDVKSLKEALIDLKAFIEPSDKVWANGVNYDMGILQHAYISHKYRIPWKYPNIMCMRSIRAIYPELNDLMKKIRADNPGKHHDALFDSICQAQALVELSELKGFSL